MVRTGRASQIDRGVIPFYDPRFLSRSNAPLLLWDFLWSQRHYQHAQLLPTSQFEEEGRLIKGTTGRMVVPQCICIVIRGGPLLCCSAECRQSWRSPPALVFFLQEKLTSGDCVYAPKKWKGWEHQWLNERNWFHSSHHALSAYNPPSGAERFATLWWPIKSGKLQEQAE